MSGSDILFEAVIVPQRSLSRRGQRVLFCVIGLACCINAGVATAVGAWPVGGFTGVELLLAVVLFRVHVAAARASELVLLTQTELRIVRTDPRGRREERVMPSAWLSVQVQERPGRVSGLWLGTQGRREEIGRSLGEEEKQALARALIEVLDRWRNPRFDNFRDE